MRRYNKVLFIILVSVLMTIAGCSSPLKSGNVARNENYVLNYTGDSEHWTVNYDITVSGQWHKASLEIQPKDKSIIGEIEYALYKNGNKKTYGREEIGTKIGGTGGGNGAKPDEGDAYAIQIKLGGKEEVFPLALMKTTE
ncbi:hypothetical protein UF75_4519 [Desulfosporosinus sp. I2]|uniref:hypothetical protein n=1 Tax=Desulfosporosinus sp. I2 TaxID=1617025 RepID=UPI0005EE6100|nr:hypothetical protein [Desulfosporosinus sp. I2]KJR45104.1 hypothetical protein UF75_4519 [Desulfosporosinus sp. I2]